MCFKKFMKKYKRIIAYYIVGFINTAVDFMIYSLMLYFTRQAVLSQGFGYLSGILCSFCLNRGITFRDRKEGSTGLQLMSFLLINLVSFGIGMLGIEYLTRSIHIHPLLAKLPVSVATSIVNYFGYKLLVFRPRPQKENQAEEMRHAGKPGKLPSVSKPKELPPHTAHDPFETMNVFHPEHLRIPTVHKITKPWMGGFHTEIRQKSSAPFEKGGETDDKRRSAGSNGI